MATVFGWRGAFFVLIVPILTTTFFALRLAEPVRGRADDPEAAAEVHKEPAVPFREAARQLWSVPTLKRQFIATAFLGAGVIPLAAYLPLYLERAFHVTPFGRGAIGSVDAACAFAGVLLSGRWTPGWFTRAAGEPARRSAYALAGTGLGLLLVAVSPSLWLAVPVAMLTSFGIGTFYPAYYAVLSVVTPARVRTLGFSFGALFLVAGVVVLFFMTGLSSVSQRDGIRAGVAVLVPYWLVASAIFYSSARFVAEDMAKGVRFLGVSAAMRRQRLEAGSASLLLCSAVDVSYESVQVLFGVDLEVKEGEMVALLGTNGAGKSTLLKAICGLVPVGAGAIFFDGQDVTHADPAKAVKAGIVQMPGGRSVFPTLTVDECLRLAGWAYRRKDPEHVRAATARVLEYFPVLSSRREQLAGDLSGGEQQMLGLAMAFISKPRLLLIDELSLGLAPAIVGQLVEIVRNIHAQGTTVVLVEQSVNLALSLARRAVFMEKGEVRFSGPTAELLERPEVLRSVFLEGAAVGLGGPAGSERMSLKRSATTSPRAPEPPVLSVRDVRVRFGGVKAVNGVSFELGAGEVLGLIGQNGAGKTTLFDAISGFVALESGQVELAGQDVSQWSPARRAAAGLGRSFQDARLFPSMTVSENISVAFERHVSVRDPISAACWLPEVRDWERQLEWGSEELMEMLGLQAYRNKFLGELSTGTRRIVDLAMAIAHRPGVLILDEPSSGIAQRETEALAPLLERVRVTIGCAVLVIEHDMPLVASISDRMLALELGAVIAEGSPDEVLAHPRVIESYLGTDASAIARSGRRRTTRTRKPAAKKPTKV